ncbi:OB-fold nucleic acid binding domain-containing protein [Candidatus Woesearchaeota archaeon]|nr:OB-fold nucleic acid binding domain-containing protein [Candidatus Woesearchaeota archaeon]
MKESILLKAAIICSLAGLILLYLVSIKIDYKEYRPQELSKNVGDDVKLVGRIAKISQKENVAFIEVEHQSLVTVVLFDKGRNLTIKNGDRIEVLGEVQEYNGKSEIVAGKLRVIS